MRRDNEGAGHRHLRVQSLVLEELEALLRDDVTDPDLTDVRVVAVVLSVDYRHARVHFVLRATPQADARLAQRALERATPFFRARLAEAIEMKRVPDLRFVFDGPVEPTTHGGGAPCSG
ncbi:MAG TPA: 30S ribosome-binding factor RbfA [Polyangiaceae bacterium]|nr:30S ribosome-binding factor RbfA [Polyangiaceae bacterium]